MSYESLLQGNSKYILCQMMLLWSYMLLFVLGIIHVFVSKFILLMSMYWSQLPLILVMHRCVSFHYVVILFYIILYFLIFASLKLFA